ncbi:alpha/beta-hydrolase [Dendrothele bispora CBS 962.96]|uniref:Alpha/beta-hydrolase n=1 Tax=Dendrothele bispora (strain CBS 962.96) TaxID=1314807 RepID=A0A4S8LKV1_DENBC|nr:alpha/beta-hydrolase [Dendrothele bispora CBS 962.96]
MSSPLSSSNHRSPLTEEVQAKSGVDSKSANPGVLEELIHYFKYASSAYTPVCPRPNGAHLVTHFSNAITDIQGFIARDEERKEIIIALRGSASIADVVLDTQVMLVPFLAPGVNAPHGTRVHSGFLVAWDSIAPSVLPLLTTQLALHPDTRRIITVGHSLGGAISTLAAMSIMVKHQQDIARGREVKNYSYGAPRIGNKIFSEFVNGRLGTNAFRVVHANDGVPTMIPRELGYHHHGIEYWQSDDPPSEDTLYQCSADGEDPSCSASIPSGGVNTAHMSYFGILATTPFCL